MTSAPTVLFYNLASASSDRKGIPFIRAARDLGIKTVVATHSSESKMLSHEIGADICEVVPFGRLFRLKELADQHNVDFCMTVNSRLTPIIADLNRGRRILGFDRIAAETINFKDRCAERIQEFGLLAPRHWIVRNFADWIRIPQEIAVLIKPTFSTGGIDTHRFNSVTELRSKLAAGWNCTALNRKITESDFYSINEKSEYFGRFMVQEHIPFKKQIGLELAIVNGTLHMVHSAEILTEKPDNILAYAHVGPVEVPTSILESLERFLKALNVINANMTPDFLIDESGQWHLIDANLNIGGEGLIESIAERGLNYPRESLQAFFGMPYSFVSKNLFVASVTRPHFSESEEPLIQAHGNFSALIEGLKIAD